MCGETPEELFEKLGQYSPTEVQAREGHINLREILGTAAGYRWNTWRDICGVYRPVSQGFLLLKTKNQSFRKGVGGQRGLAQGNPAHTIDSGHSSAPFSYAPLSVAEHTFGGDFLLLQFGRSCSPTPSRQPLFETSEKTDKSISAGTPVSGVPATPGRAGDVQILHVIVLMCLLCSLEVTKMRDERPSQL